MFRQKKNVEEHYKGTNKQEEHRGNSKEHIDAMKKKKEMAKKMPNHQSRLEYLRKQIKQENISYGEIAELQSLKKHIKPGDVELEEWAGKKERHLVAKKIKHGESFQNKLRKGSQENKGYLKQELKDQGYK